MKRRSRSTESVATSADVSSCPSWNFTPRRSVKMYFVAPDSRPLGEVGHDGEVIVQRHQITEIQLCRFSRHIVGAERDRGCRGARDADDEDVGIGRGRRMQR